MPTPKSFRARATSLRPTNTPTHRDLNGPKPPPSKNSRSPGSRFSRLTSLPVCSSSSYDAGIGRPSAASRIARANAVLPMPDFDVPLSAYGVSFQRATSVRSMASSLRRGAASAGGGDADGGGSDGGGSDDGGSDDGGSDDGGGDDGGGDETAGEDADDEEGLDAAAGRGFDEHAPAITAIVMKTEARSLPSIYWGRPGPERDATFSQILA